MSQLYFLTICISGYLSYMNTYKQAHIHIYMYACCFVKKLSLRSFSHVCDLQWKKLLHGCQSVKQIGELHVFPHQQSPAVPFIKYCMEKAWSPLFKAVISLVKAKTAEIHKEKFLNSQRTCYTFPIAQKQAHILL